MEKRPCTKTDGWYEAWDLGDGIWRISDHGQDNMYLIIGTEKAILFDTGFGAGELATFVASITDKPVSVVMGHGHPDHACGNDFFPVTYGAMEDIRGWCDNMTVEKLAAIRAGVRQDQRLSIEKKAGKDTAGAKTKEEPKTATPVPGENIPVEDGCVLELGGRKLTLYKVPGHTPGSLCALDDSTNTLFTTDTYVATRYWGPMWLHLKNCAPFSVYRDSLRKMVDLKASTLLCGHGEVDHLPAAELESYAQMVADICDGKLTGEPEETIAGPGLLARRGDTAVLYRAENL